MPPLSPTYARQERMIVRTGLALAAALLIAPMLFPGLNYIFPREHYIWIHTLTEIFGVVISLAISALIWNTAKHGASFQEILLGGIFFAAGVLSVFHTLSHSDMPDFLTPNTPAKMIYFCLAGRSILTFGLLAYGMLINMVPDQRFQATPIRWRHRYRTIVYGLSALITGFVFITVTFYPNVLPQVATGQGLTLQRAAPELALAIVLALDGFLIGLSRSAGEWTNMYMRVGIALRVLGQIGFVVSLSRDTYSLISHLYLTLSDYFFYLALFMLAVQRPYLEIRALCRQTVEAEKLKHLGEMAAGAAHEIRNPLTAIRGFIQLIEQSLAKEAPAREWARLVLGELDRISGIVRRMMLLAKPMATDLPLHDVGQVVDEVILVAQKLHKPAGLSISTEIGHLPPVRMDADQMKQVFLNVLTNAFEAMPGGGTVTVRGEELNTGGICIELADEGVGIPQGAIGRVLEPFYTTKECGTGLGLSVAESIVRSHGGHIRIESNPGKGTTVRIILPGNGIPAIPRVPCSCDRSVKDSLAEAQDGALPAGG